MVKRGTSLNLLAWYISDNKVFHWDSLHTDISKGTVSLGVIVPDGNKSWHREVDFAGPSGTLTFLTLYELNLASAFL